MPRPYIHIVDDLPHPIAFNASLLHIDIWETYTILKDQNKWNSNRDNAGNRKNVNLQFKSSKDKMLHL